MEMLKLERPLQICTQASFGRIQSQRCLLQCKDWAIVAAGEELEWEMRDVGGEHGHLYSKTGEKDLKHVSSSCNQILPRKM